jgi:DNA polymerase-3 subunit epsilon
MRFWGKTIPEGEMESERTWLLQDIYSGHGEPVFHPQSACERYR